MAMSEDTQGAETERKVFISAASRTAEATSLAAKADDDKELMSCLAGVAEAAKFIAKSPYLIWERLLAIYGQDGMDALPVPNTQAHDPKKENYVEGLNNPDIYLRPTKRRGTVDEAEESYINVFAENLKPIRELRDVIEDARRRSEKEYAGEDKLGPMQAEGIRNTAQKDIDRMRDRVKKAIKFHHQWTRAKEYVTVKFSIVTERVYFDDIDPKTKRKRFEEQVANTPNIIRLEDKEDRALWADYTIEQFNGLDFATAEWNGGTFQDLIKTLKRETQQPDGTEEGGIVVNNLGQAQSAANAFASFLNEDVNYNKLYAFLDKASKGDDVAKEMLVSLDVIYGHLANLLGRHAKLIESLKSTQG